VELLIFNPYGNLPGERWRDYRTTMLAKAAARNQGHVMVYASLLEHRSQCRRDPVALRVEAAKIGVDLVFARHFVKYSNVSIRRGLNELAYGLDFLIYALRNRNNLRDTKMYCVEPAPIASFFCLAVSILLKKPLIYDVLDLFPESLGPSIGSRVSLLVSVFSWLRKIRLSSAAGIVYCAEDYQAMLHQFDSPSKVCYLGVPEGSDGRSAFDSVTYKSCQAFLREVGCVPKLIYAGSIGSAYGLDLLIDQLIVNTNDFRLVLIGRGAPMQLAKIQSRIEQSEGKILLLDPVDPLELETLYGLFDIGVICYRGSSPVSMPVKFYDYLKAGLFILSNCQGESSDLINRFSIGYIANGDWSDCSAGLLVGADFKIDQFEKLRETLDSRLQHDVMWEFIKQL